jgi:hypothetical protein
VSIQAYELPILSGTYTVERGRYFSSTGVDDALQVRISKHFA